ncbi:hypothetical protein IH992_31980, partial [Candidatus Poribacteria bacterium]|nr:hypothetical protein [Candidatus Poribacteria bacterium]
EREPNNPLLLNNYARFIVDNLENPSDKLLQNARSYAERAVEIEQDAKYYDTLGWVHFQLNVNDDDSALKFLTQAKELQSKINRESSVWEDINAHLGEVYEKGQKQSQVKATSEEVSKFKKAYSVSTLIKQIGDANRTERSKALIALRDDHRSNPKAIRLALELCEKPKIAGFWTTGRVNALHFLAGTDRSVWTDEQIARADKVLIQSNEGLSQSPPEKESLRRKTFNRFANHILSFYTIAIYFHKNREDLREVANDIQKRLINYDGFKGKVELRPKDDSFFERVFPPNTDEIRYEQENETGVADSLLSILKQIYPTRQFRKRTVGIPTPEFISIFLK